MLKGPDIESRHPLRKFFKKALHYSQQFHPAEKEGVTDYIEEQILCEFIHVDRLNKIRNMAGKALDDVAEMLEEGDVLLNAESFSQEFTVHKHIGDYTLFMLGMFPAALSRKKGREYILGRLVIPGAHCSDYYVMQGKRSYRIASDFTHRELFLELSENFLLYRNILDFVRIYLESVRNEEFLKARRIIGGTG